MKLFKYGMRLRGFSIGTQPGGVYDVQDADKQADGYWNYLLYTKRLTDDQASQYDLDYIGEE